MRFRFVIGIVLLLTLQGSESAIEVGCDESSFEPCEITINEVNDEDFRIFPTDHDVLKIKNRKGVKFLPINLSSASSEFESIVIINCSVSSIKKFHFKGLSKLTRLNLEFNEIEDVASDSFVDLVSLKIFVLSGNRIQSLRKRTFASLKSLKQLYLDGNEIENIASNAFKDLVSLIELDLNGNRIQSLGRQTFASQKSLIRLHLHNNEIQFLQPKIFSSLANVELLDLSSNEIVSLDENVFESLTNLKEITIIHNKLKEISEDWFKKNTKLERISLRGNKIKNIDRTIFDYLPNLAQFDLRYRTGNDANWLHISSSRCGVSKLATGLVVFGRNFKRGDYPWTVALMMKTQPPSYFCTGTIISSTFVLSAAHCIIQKQSDELLLARDILAFFGAHDLDNTLETARFSLSPKKIIVHEDWNPNTSKYDADLSLLEFEKGKIIFNDFVQPICFWPSKDEPNEIRGEVVGWGRSENKMKKHETVAKVVDAVIQTNEQCFLDKKALVDISSHRTFCAGLRNGSGVCTGDSGAGLIIKVKGVSILRGVVSSSLVKNEDCDVHNNAIYTNVFKFKEWIEKMTGEDLLTPTEALSFESGNVVFCKFEHKICRVTEAIDSEDFVLGSELDSNVETFHISQNMKVKFVPRGIIEKLPNLKRFTIRSCGLTVVRNHNLKKMQKLEFLDLCKNQITTIEPEAFKDLVSVNVLWLFDNLIETLDEKLFASMVSLGEIILRNNKIKFLSPTTFKIPGGSLWHVHLKGNVCINQYYGNFGSSMDYLEHNLRTYCPRN